MAFWKNLYRRACGRGPVPTKRPTALAVAGSAPARPDPWNIQQNPVLSVAGGIVLAVFAIFIGLPLALTLVGGFVVLMAAAFFGAW